MLEILVNVVKLQKNTEKVHKDRKEEYRIDKNWK